jgi:hypothetical protein
VEVLRERLASVCGDELRVVLDDGIVADAAAGGDCIKLRADAMFSTRDLRVLEVHEGWVHVATTLNGRHQPWCTFLGKGTPSTTSTQEGLALVTEITTMSSRPDPLRKVTRRALRSPGVVLPALEARGEEALRERLMAAVERFRADNGSYRIVNELTYVTAGAT